MHSVSRAPDEIQPAPPHRSTRWRSVIALLRDSVSTRSDAPAVSFPAGRASYRELGTLTAAAARRLLAAGVRKGDRVGILLREGCAEYVAYGLGAMCVGAISVPVNARNKVRELNHVVRHSGMALLITNHEFEDLLTRAGLPWACRTVLLGDAGFEGGEQQVDPADVDRAEAAVERDDPALILYTSGTTADPKGCVHSHATLLAEGENCAERLGMLADDRYWTPLPLFHIGGWQVLLTTMSRGACFVHAGQFEATRALDQLEGERVSHAFPAFELIWNDVLNHPRFPSADLSALRVIQAVGAPERLEQMQAQVPHGRQISNFGSTESCGSICLGDPAHDSLHSRMHTCGRPMRGVDVRVVDPHTGHACPPETPGELEFRGVTRFVCYYGDPNATAASIDEDGWFRTGDLVSLHEDGTLSFISRLKDMLKVGGENVSAADIEGYLITHPAVAVATVIGVRDGRYGEVPAAFVTLVDGATVTEQELIEFCIGNIATYKVPRYVRIVDEFPVTPTQKIQKYVLRDRMNAELDALGISEAPKVVSRR